MARRWRGFRGEHIQGLCVHIKTETWWKLRLCRLVIQRTIFFTWADNQHVGSAFVKENYGRAVAWAHSKYVPLFLTESAWVVFTQNWGRV